MDQGPWLHIEAGSEQAQPVYLGASPREIQLFSLERPCSIPAALKSRGEAQIRWLLSKLPSSQSAQVQLEGWPAYDDGTGQWTWSWARWRFGADTCWKFIDIAADTYSGHEKPFTPKMLRPWMPDEEEEIFADFLTIPDLYAKPAFGDCIFTSEAETATAPPLGWLPLETIDYQRNNIANMNQQLPIGNRTLCRVLPQPARCNGIPTAYVVNISSTGSTQHISWPSNALFASMEQSLPPLPSLKLLIQAWDPSFNEMWADDIRVLAGEIDAVFPISGRQATFSRKNRHVLFFSCDVAVSDFGLDLSAQR